MQFSNVANFNLLTAVRLDFNMQVTVVCLDIYQGPYMHLIAISKMCKHITTRMAPPMVNKQKSCKIPDVPFCHLCAQAHGRYCCDQLACHFAVFSARTSTGFLSVYFHDTCSPQSTWLVRTKATINPTLPKALQEVVDNWYAGSWHSKLPISAV